MPKLTIEDLKKIREKARGTVVLREGAGRAKVTVHMGTCGIASGARDIMDALMSEIETKDVHDVIVTTSGCAGLCSREPMATVELQGKPPVKYVDLTKEKIKKFLKNMFWVAISSPNMRWLLAVKERTDRARGGCEIGTF